MAANMPRRLPRASGGVSYDEDLERIREKSSPRKRGCFLTIDEALDELTVFPAQAGVFLLKLL